MRNTPKPQLWPAVLDQPFGKRGELVILELGGIRGTITTRAHQSCRFILYADRTSNSIEFPLESYSTTEGVAVGAWGLLKAWEKEGSRRVRLRQICTALTRDVHLRYVRKLDE